jgi:hypothetical protein
MVSDASRSEDLRTEMSMKWYLLKVVHDGAIVDVPQAIQCAESSPSVRKKNVCHLLVILCLDLFVVIEVLVLLLGRS